MKTNIRKARFKQLIDNRFGGKQRDMANAVGIAEDLVSRYLSGTKAIGERMKAKIEKTLQLPENWLDGNDTELSLTVENRDLWVMFNHLIHLPPDEIDRFKQIYELTLGVEFERINNLERRNSECLEENANLRRRKTDNLPEKEKPES